MTHGIVLDILRCSLHDGPGIRTTVFLKGCPLSCLWCHNPESQDMRPVLSCNADRCGHCGQCQRVCPNGCHSVSADDHTIDRSRCTACGACVVACPAAAMEVKGRSMSVDEVMNEVVKDRDYYRESAGGMTLSGGEPMSQFDFTLALAAAARQAGIHTAIETSGLAPFARYEAILPHIDLFLYDHKGTDTARHLAQTGVSNHVIRENLDRLYAAGAKIILRCPMVPGLNDTDADLAGIAAMSQRYPNLLGIELMPYHRMGNEKARRVGLPVRLDIPNADEAVKQAWRAGLQRHGCREVVIN